MPRLDNVLDVLQAVLIVLAFAALAATIYVAWGVFIGG